MSHNKCVLCVTVPQNLPPGGILKLKILIVKRLLPVNYPDTPVFSLDPSTSSGQASSGQVLRYAIVERLFPPPPLHLPIPAPALPAKGGTALTLFVI